MHATKQSRVSSHQLLTLKEQRALARLELKLASAPENYESLGRMLARKGCLRFSTRLGEFCGPEIMANLSIVNPDYNDFIRESGATINLCSLRRRFSATELRSFGLAQRSVT